MDVLEAGCIGCWINPHTKTTNIQQQTFSSNPLRKLLHIILHGKKIRAFVANLSLLVIRPTMAKQNTIKVPLVDLESLSIHPF